MTALVALGVGIRGRTRRIIAANELLALTMVGMTGCAVSPMSLEASLGVVRALTVIGVDLLLRVGLSVPRAGCWWVRDWWLCCWLRSLARTTRPRHLVRAALRIGPRRLR